MDSKFFVNKEIISIDWRSIIIWCKYHNMVLDAHRDPLELIYMKRGMHGISRDYVDEFIK